MPGNCAEKIANSGNVSKNQEQMCRPIVNLMATENSSYAYRLPPKIFFPEAKENGTSLPEKTFSIKMSFFAIFFKISSRLIGHLY
jgi:hypothetical protein